MALESASFINGLVSTNPTGSDSISQGDDHLRLLKTVLKASLPDVDQAAATVIVKATAPTTQVKGTIWYDTSADKIKINTATTGSSPNWVELGVGAPWNGTGFNTLAGSCMFRVWMDTDQTLNNAVYEKLQFDTEEFDIGSNFDVSNYYFTAPVDGKYYFHAMMRSAATHGSDDDLAIYKNSTAYAQQSTFEQVSGPAYVTTSPTLMVSCIMDMTAGDTASVYAHTETGPWSMAGGSSNSNTFFEGYRLA
jgi:hypothetical protein